MFSGVGGGLLAAPRTAEAIAVYDELRRTDPVHRLADGGWLLTRYEDAKAVLRDTRFSSNDKLWKAGEDAQDLPHDPKQWMLFLDPPHHTRLRRLVQQAFQPRRIKQLEPGIADAVDDLLDAVADKGEMDIITDLARPLPVWVICTMLDVPAADRERITEQAQEMSLLLDAEYLDETSLDRAAAASEETRAYFDWLIDERRKDLGDDILSGLIAAEADGQMLSKEEIVAMADLLFLAGHETTVNLIGNGTRTMLDHEGTLERLAREPDLIPSAVEECLRYAPSVSLTGRTATEELPIGDKTTAKGDYVLIPMDAVNRDPERFPDPHSFDIARKDNAHLTFAIGPHICLGASLARLEGKVAWGRLLARFRDFEALAPSHYREHVVLRGLESVKVAFKVAA
jgi:cytochrome P450